MKNFLLLLLIVFIFHHTSENVRSTYFRPLSLVRICNEIQVVPFKIFKLVGLVQKQNVMIRYKDQIMFNIFNPYLVRSFHSLLQM